MKRNWKYLVLCTALLVAGIAVEAQSAPEGNPARGASLYEGCVPCHTMMGKGIAGKPVDVLMSKMENYQTGTFDNPKIQGMHKVLKPMSKQDLMDLASYITKM